MSDDAVKLIAALCFASNCFSMYNVSLKRNISKWAKAIFLIGVGLFNVAIIAWAIS